MGDIAPDPRWSLVHSEAQRALLRQAARVDEVRGRCVGVMGASSIAASVLGLSLGDDPRRAFVFGGLVGFVTVVGATLVVLWPYSWTFHCGPKAMAAGYIEQGYSIDDMLRDHSEELETFYDKNDLRLQKMYKALQLAVMGLGLEVLFLMLDVLVGG